MMLFKNMKIRGKLFVGFFLLLAITVFIAAFGVVNINRINANYTYLEDFPSGRYDTLNYLAREIMDIRRIVTAMAFRQGDIPTLNQLRGESMRTRTAIAWYFDMYQTSLQQDPYLDAARIMQVTADSDAVRALLDSYFDQVLGGVFDAASEGIPGDPTSRARIDMYLELGVEVYADIEAAFNQLRDAAQETIDTLYPEIQAATQDNDDNGGFYHYWRYLWHSGSPDNIHNGNQTNGPLDRCS